MFVVTGAAGSIVSAITADLAAASGGTFYLLDLVPEPDANNPDLKRFASDKDGLKRDLFARIQARGERATPALVEKELAALERAQAALSAIDAVRAAGGTAHYFSVNLADAEGVAKVIDQVRQQSGRIDVLLHAAGLERSHFLPDKDPREFDLVFDVKADGWFNLLHAIGDMPLGATVAFSSIAGRFGNAGQTDYSAANDLLCKYTSSFRTTRPLTRGIVIDWTAWGGIGMATRGSIPKMMELAGIDMLPPEAGVPLDSPRTHRGRNARRSRGRPGVWARCSTNGMRPEAWIPPRWKLPPRSLPAQGPMVGKITGMGLYSGLTMETTLDPTVQPFLHDHRIDGTPVLPGVMGIEAFAEAALCVHPGWHIEAIEEVNFLAPFKFYRDEPRTVTIQAFFYPQGDKLVADCRLIGRRKLPNQAEPQETTTLHGAGASAQTAARSGDRSGSAVVGRSHRASGANLSHLLPRSGVPGSGSCLVGWNAHDRRDGGRVAGQSSAVGSADADGSAADRVVLPDCRTVGDGRAAAGWACRSRCARCSWLRAPQSAEGRLYAVVTPHPEQDSFDAEVVDAAGNRYVRLGGYRTAARPRWCRCRVVESRCKPSCRRKPSPCHELAGLPVTEVERVAYAARISASRYRQSRGSRDALHPRGPRVQSGARGGAAHHCALHRP